MIKVAFSFYQKGSETNRWDEMPQIPKVSETVHYSLSDDPDDSRAWLVGHVSWAREPGKDWHAEVGLS
jgi:hypothetical protein